MDYMTDKHSMVQGRGVEAIMKHHHPNYEQIAQNKTIS
jgi:hypothetical protein